MTDRTPPTNAELADVLTDAARRVSGILTAEYPTAAGRSHLHPVLGALAAGPQVAGELNDRFETFVATEPRPATPAGLFALASYASALGWLTESLAELTAAVDRICTYVDNPTEPPSPVSGVLDSTELGGDFGFAFSERELTAIRSAAETAGLSPEDYVEVLTTSLLASAKITDACLEITSGLLDDAAYLRDEVTDHVWIVEGPESLPTLVRSLLARMEVAE